MAEESEVEERWELWYLIAMGFVILWSSATTTVLGRCWGRRETFDFFGENNPFGLNVFLLLLNRYSIVLTVHSFCCLFLITAFGTFVGDVSKKRDLLLLSHLVVSISEIYLNQYCTIGTVFPTSVLASETNYLFDVKRWWCGTWYPLSIICPTQSFYTRRFSYWKTIMSWEQLVLCYHRKNEKLFGSGHFETTMSRYADLHLHYYYWKLKAQEMTQMKKRIQGRHLRLRVPPSVLVAETYDSRSGTFCYTIVYTRFRQTERNSSLPSRQPAPARKTHCCLWLCPSLTLSSPQQHPVVFGVVETRLSTTLFGKPATPPPWLPSQKDHEKHKNKNALL